MNNWLNSVQNKFFNKFPVLNIMFCAQVFIL